MTKPIPFQFLAVPPRAWPLGIVLEHADRMVLAVMMDRWRTADVIAIGSAALVDETGCSESTTDRSIDHLIELELLERASRGGGRGRPATYRLGRKTIRRIEDDLRRKGAEAKGVVTTPNQPQPTTPKGGHGGHVSDGKGGQAGHESDGAKGVATTPNETGKGVKKGGYGPPKKVATMTPPSEIRSARAREAEHGASSLAPSPAESIRDPDRVGGTPPYGAGAPPPKSARVHVVNMTSGFDSMVTEEELAADPNLQRFEDVYGARRVG